MTLLLCLNQPFRKNALALLWSDFKEIEGIENMRLEGHFVWLKAELGDHGVFPQNLSDSWP